MCFNEKLSHLTIIKSRNAELFVFKKNDFLRLSFNFKEFVENFLQRSIIHYIKFNDEKKKAIESYEREHELDESVEENSLEKISEREDEKNSDAEEFNVYDKQSNNITEREKKKQKKISGGVNEVKEESEENSFSNSSESNSDSQSKSSKSDDSFVSKSSYSSEVSKSSSENKSNRKNKESEEKSHKDEKHKLKSERSKKSHHTDKTHKTKKSIKSHKTHKTTKTQKSAKTSNIKNSKVKSKNKDEKINTKSKEFNINSSIVPILELNDHIEKIKNDIFLDFASKIEKIIKFLEDNKINFDQTEASKNPIELLKKLAITKEVNERSDILEILEVVTASL
jgi:hypothetical protein